ncbi:MAG: hypothetical protein WCA08_19690 [Desulfoferrobacter sp.]
MKRRAFLALCFAFILTALLGTYGAAMDSYDQEASQFSNFLAPEYTPPVAKGIFADVPVEYWASGWIEQLYFDGITKGCTTNPLSYCPESYVTRAEMAAFLLRLRYGGDPPPEAASISLVGTWSGTAKGILPNGDEIPEYSGTANITHQSGSLFSGTYEAMGAQALVTGNVSADKSIHVTVSVQIEGSIQVIGAMDAKWESENQISGVARDFTDGSTSYFTMQRDIE